GDATSTTGTQGRPAHGDGVVRATRLPSTPAYRPRPRHGREDRRGGTCRYIAHSAARRSSRPAESGNSPHDDLHDHRARPAYPGRTAASVRHHGMVGLFPPLTTTATTAPGAETYAPDISAARAVQPPGSARTRQRCHNHRRAATMSSSRSEERR